MDDTRQRKRLNASSLRISIKAIPTASGETRKRGFSIYPQICVGLPSGGSKRHATFSFLRLDAECLTWMRRGRSRMVMKKALVLTIAMVAISTIADTWIDPDTGIEWRYSVKNGVATVGSGVWSHPAVPTTTTGAIEIPRELGGYPVEKLAMYAFINCTGITSVTIPDTIKKITLQSFHGCTNLVSVTIPNSVTNIDNQAFQKCSALASITIPKSVTWIGGDVFNGCVSLTNVTINASVTSLAGVFVGCRNLECVTIPDSVTNIGNELFMNCSRLRSVTLSSSAKAIGDSAFMNCGSLKEIEIPNSVTKIGAWAFASSGLTKVTIPDSVTNISEYAFSGCGGLESVNVGRGVAGLGKEAFAGCGALTQFVVSADNPNYRMSDIFLLSKDGSTLVAGINANGAVVLPDGISSIGDFAFSSSGGMTDVTIPDSVVDIGHKAFYSCTSLTNAPLPESLANIDYGAFENCKKLTSVTVPGSVTNVGDSAFWDCSSLMTAYLPMSLKGIVYESGVFYIASGRPAVKYRLIDGPFEIGEPVVWANTRTHGEERISTPTPINESNFDFMIPATDDLPAGVKVRIKRITFASVNDSFTPWDGSTSKSDPSFVRLNGVNSDKITSFSGTIGTMYQYVDRNALIYTFSSPCDVIVGRKYPAVTGNNAGGVGDGIALLADNGKLLYGNNADRASVVYVRTSDSSSLVSTTSAENITGQTGWYPSYRIEAEVLELESSALDGGTFVEYSDIQTSESNFPYNNLAARTQPFSFMLYADVSSMPSTGKAIICEFGNLWSHMALLYREGNEIKFGIGNANGVFGTVASVEVCPGYHLYTAICDPTTGHSYLRLDGGDESVGFSGGAATLGNGFQIGSIYGGIGSTFIAGSSVEIVKLLGYNEVFSTRDIATLVAKYPARYSEVSLPVIDGDEGAEVTGDSESGYTIKPSEGKMYIVVTIPDGVEARMVTVEVSAEVETVTANGANVKVMKGEHDIAEHLDLVAVTQDGVINLASAQVKPEVVKEALDTEKGAEINISNSESPELTTSETKPGLTYTLLEGTTLEEMKSCTDGDSKLGDGTKWTPTIQVKGGPSAFYTIEVSK